MRVAEDVSPLELRTIAGGAAGATPPADPATCPDASAPRLVSTRASQLRDDLGEVLHYTLLAGGDIIRLRRAQDTLDGTAPALTRAGRPFDRRPYAYPVLIPSALG